MKPSSLSYSPPSQVNLIRIPPMDGVINRLYKLDYLPAIWFM